MAALSEIYSAARGYGTNRPLTIGTVDTLLANETALLSRFEWSSLEHVGRTTSEDDDEIFFSKLFSLDFFLFNETMAKLYCVGLPFCFKYSVLCYFSNGYLSHGNLLRKEVFALVTHIISLKATAL